MDVTIPAVGESITEGVLASWLVEDGSWVEEGQDIYELETDKVSSEVAAEVSGRIAIQVAEGETVAVGSTIATIDESADKPALSDEPERNKDTARQTGESADDGGDQEQADTTEPADQPEQDQEPAPARDGKSPVSPAARRLIDEHDLDASSIDGTGRKGTITKDDVRRVLDSRRQESSEPKTSPAATTTRQKPDDSVGGSLAADGPVGPAERKPMSPLRRRIAQRLVNAQRTAAILTTFNEVDMGAVMAMRSRHKERFAERHETGLGFMSFFTKATVAALQRYPLINSFIDGDDVITPEHINMGIAVGTDRGLVVPVLREAETMDFADIEREIRRHAANARDGKLKLSDMEGGTFTITNGGVYGSMMSTPIINPPQSGILGMHAIQDRPVARDGEVVIRPMMYIALSYDHRIVDGAEAVGFLVRIKECIEAPERMLLDI